MGLIIRLAIPVLIVAGLIVVIYSLLKENDVQFPKLDGITDDKDLGNYAERLKKANDLLKIIGKEAPEEQQEVIEHRVQMTINKLREILVMAAKLDTTITEMEKDVSDRDLTNLSEKMRESLNTQLTMLYNLKDRRKQLEENADLFIIQLQNLQLAILESNSGSVALNERSADELLSRLENSTDEILKQAKYEKIISQQRV